MCDVIVVLVSVRCLFSRVFSVCMCFMFLNVFMCLLSVVHVSYVFLCVPAVVSCSLKGLMVLIVSLLIVL